MRIEMMWLDTSKENQIFLVTHVNLTSAYQKCHILIIALKFCMRALFDSKEKSLLRC